MWRYQWNRGAKRQIVVIRSPTIERLHTSVIRTPRSVRTYVIAPRSDIDFGRTYRWPLPPGASPSLHAAVAAVPCAPLPLEATLLAAPLVPSLAALLCSYAYALSLGRPLRQLRRSPASWCVVRRKRVSSILYPPPPPPDAWKALGRCSQPGT